MFTLKGFALIGALADNATGVVAPLGELSPQGFTSAREKTHHVSPAAPNIKLVTFTSQVDGTHTPPDPTLINTLLPIIDWIYLQGASGKFNSSITAFQQLLLAQYGGVISLNGSGDMIRSGTLYLPAYVDLQIVAAGENTLKFWFSNDAFLSQYDDSETLCLSPLEPVDTFFNGYSVIKPLIDALTWPDMLTRAEVLKAGFPETKLRADTFDWVDPVDRTVKIPVDFTTVIYGAAGDNIDNIKLELVEFLLGKSTHTREEWAVIFPDLFTSTEFIVTPMYNDYAIPNSDVTNGLYSSTTLIADAIALANKSCIGTGYTKAHIDSVLSVSGCTYKAIQLVIVGGPNNRDGINKFKDQWVDYIAVESTHVDFKRMSQATRAFILMLFDMLRYAESMTPNTSVPVGYTRMTREGVVYLVKSYLKVQYLVVTKYSVEQLSAPVTP